ncbi:MAG: FimV family protein, partial [Luteimonas sp.]
MAIALAFAGPAAALGLGQIQVKSQPGQPLLAEIPIISSDPSELEGLQAQLASPETFRRVGLEPPQGAASSLRFEPAIDAAGRPVIRVTSTVPIQ